MASAVEVPSSERRRGRLLQILGFGFGIAVIVGNTIGVGMLRTPGNVATQLPNRELFLAVWIVGALCTFLAATNITELGTMLPYSGGHYTFARHALGEYPGFVIGWTDWLLRIRWRYDEMRLRPTTSPLLEVVQARVRRDPVQPRLCGTAIP